MYLKNPGYPKPYEAQVSRGGKQVSLGSFATAEEAALCVARSPEGREAAGRPAAAPPLTSLEVRQQAEAERLTLLKADNKAGYFGVCLKNPGRPKPYQVQVTRGGKQVNLGSFATAEEAALCVARSPEGREAAERAAAAPPLAREEARQQARAEGLTLRLADNKTGYFGVYLEKPGYPKPYQARVRRGGKQVNLGYFATAEEAALCVARSPEGRTAAAKQAAPQLSEEEGKGTVPPMPPGAFVKEEDVPAAAVVKEEGAVPPMPPDAFVVKTEVVVKEEGRSCSRPKRQRRK